MLPKFALCGQTLHSFQSLCPKMAHISLIFNKISADGDTSCIARAGLKTGSYPFHIDSKYRLKKAAFRPPNGSRQISVLRSQLTTISFRRDHAKSMEKNDKKFRGFACVTVKAVHECDLDAKATPLPDLPMHADIVFPHTFHRNEPLPPRIQKSLLELSRKADFFPESSAG